jgi:phage-related protein
MGDRTSHIALWAQGRALSAALQARNLYKVATAISEAGKRLLLLLVSKVGRNTVLQKYLGTRDAGRGTRDAEKKAMEGTPKQQA